MEQYVGSTVKMLDFSAGKLTVRVEDLRAV